MGRGKNSLLHVMRAESPGPQVDKLVPRLQNSAKILYAIYIALTLIQIVFLLAGGMPLFDSFCTAFGTAGTGGFGVRNDSMAGYSPYLQTVCTVFMALFGINFSIFYLLLLRQFSRVFRNEELRLYLLVMLSAIALITINTLPNFDGNVGEAFHHVAVYGFFHHDYHRFCHGGFQPLACFLQKLLVLLMIFRSLCGFHRRRHQSSPRRTPL